MPIPAFSDKTDYDKICRSTSFSIIPSLVAQLREKKKPEFASFYESMKNR